jgi:14-3-3 protein epsilon
MAKPERLGDTVLRTKLLPIKAKIFREMKNFVAEVSALIDTKLLANAVDASAKIFYYKFKADAYRYLCEVPDTPERSEFVGKATEAYGGAMTYAEEALPKRNPLFLGLILNYAVFLFEIAAKKTEALALLETTFAECSKPTDEQIEEDVASDTHILLQMMRDNLALWKRGDNVD